MIETQRQASAATAAAPLSVIDLRVAREDWGRIALGTLYILIVALPIGYGTGFLVSPHAPNTSLFRAVVDIAQIVLFEEILFRAFLFRWLGRSMSLQAAAISSAVIFGVLHLIQFPYPMALMATWAGYILALEYHRTSRISTPMLIHAVLVAVQFFVLPVA